MNSDFSTLADYRSDGRKANELRETSIQLGIDQNYDGSCLYKQGLTQVLCLIRGPYQRPSNTDELLKIQYTVAPFSSLQKRKGKFDREFSEFAESIRKSFESVIIPDTYARSQIQVTVTVIENQGSAKSCVMNCITLGLTNAGICMKDLLISCTVGSYNGQYLIDTNDEEEFDSGNQVIVSYLQREKQIDYLELRKAKIKEEELTKIYRLTVKGCEQLYRRVRKSLFDHAYKKMLVF